MDTSKKKKTNKKNQQKKPNILPCFGFQISDPILHKVRYQNSNGGRSETALSPVFEFWHLT